MNKSRKTINGKIITFSGDIKEFVLYMTIAVSENELLGNEIWSSEAPPVFDICSDLLGVCQVLF